MRENLILDQVRICLRDNSYLKRRTSGNCRKCWHLWVTVDKNGWGKGGQLVSSQATLGTKLKSLFQKIKNSDHKSLIPAEQIFYKPYGFTERISKLLALLYRSSLLMQRWAGQPTVGLRRGMPRLGFLFKPFPITDQGVALNEADRFGFFFIEMGLEARSRAEE